jgi:quercetin dioxygenase-like cupin family protein
MEFDNTGWTFTDSTALDWMAVGEKVEMKSMGGADGKMIALFRFAPGYVGKTHHHEEPEFSYVLEGDLVSNGVPMSTGHAYAVKAGTTHEEFRSEAGCTIVSVFKSPS